MLAKVQFKLALIELFFGGICIMTKIDSWLLIRWKIYRAVRQTLRSCFWICFWKCRLISYGASQRSLFFYQLLFFTYRLRVKPLPLQLIDVPADCRNVCFNHTSYSLLAYSIIYSNLFFSILFILFLNVIQNKQRCFLMEQGSTIKLIHSWTSQS